jgi:hypothetical protein
LSGFSEVLILAGHSEPREEVKHLIVIDEMNSLGMKADEMSAVFAAFIAYA